MEFISKSVRNAPIPGARRKNDRANTERARFDSPIGFLTPGQKAMWEGMNESERELTKLFFHVPDVDMKKIDLRGSPGFRQLAVRERRKEDGKPRFLNLEDEEDPTDAAAEDTGSVTEAGIDETAPARWEQTGAGGPQAVETTTGDMAVGQNHMPRSGGADAAYRDLLLQKARKDPRLYANAAFVQELRNAELRMQQAGETGALIPDRYLPERYWREAAGSIMNAVQNGINAVSMIGREVQAGHYASSAMDQRFLGTLAGKKDYFDRADSLIALSEETADRALEPAVDFASRYRAKTAELYPASGPAQRFLNRVIGGTASMIPSIVSNLLVPGSGIYINMLQGIGGAMAEAKEQGADDSAALAYAVSVGIADTMLEKLVDGLGGVFGKGKLDSLIGETVRRAAGNPAVQEALIYLGGMAGEGFEEMLSVFADELLNVHMLGATARTWESLLEEAGLSFFAGALVSGLVQGASRLGALLNSGAEDLTVEDLGRQLAEEVEAELRDSPVETEPIEAEPANIPESEAIPEPEQNNAETALDDIDKSEYTLTQKRQEQVRANNKKGMDYEDREFPLFRLLSLNAQRHITLVTESGIRMVADAIGTMDGSIVIMEYKSSLTARLSKNQKQVFDALRDQAVYVVGKGKGSFTGGTRIPPISEGTQVIVQRPGKREVWK